MNVDKMRHQSKRNAEAAERHEHDRWLAGMTPQHRAKHVGPFPTMLCGECMNAGLAVFAKTIADMNARIADRHA